jgi:hypothetical protein
MLFDSEFFNIVLCFLLEWVFYSHNKFRGEFLQYFIVILFEPW